MLPFFNGHAEFEQSEDDKNLYYWENPEKDAVDYDKFMIDPVLIYQSPHASPAITPENRAELALLFRELAVKAFQGAVEIVDEPGVDVLLLRLALRGLKPGRYYMDSMGTKKVKEDTTLAAGTFELEAIDSVTGIRVVGLVHHLHGEGFKTEDQLAKFLNVKVAFSDWVKMLRRKLDEARKKAQ